MWFLPLVSTELGIMGVFKSDFSSFSGPAQVNPTSENGNLVTANFKQK